MQVEIQKSQNLRLIDVFLVGPGMMFAGWRSNVPLIFRLGLMYAGAATIIYNGRNYLINKKLMDEGEVIPLNLWREIKLKLESLTDADQVPAVKDTTTAEPVDVVQVPRQQTQTTEVFFGNVRY